MTHLIPKAYICHWHSIVYSSLLGICLASILQPQGQSLREPFLATLATLLPDFHLLCHLLTHHRPIQKAIFSARHDGKPAVPELGRVMQEAHLGYKEPGIFIWHWSLGNLWFKSWNTDIGFDIQIGLCCKKIDYKLTHCFERRFSNFFFIPSSFL